MSSNIHHHNPQFSLKPWVGPDGRLCVLHRPYRNVVPIRKPTKGTGWVRDLYRVPDTPRRDGAWVEDQFLKRVDQLAYDALQLVLADRLDDLVDERRDAWSRYIMALHFRNPEEVARLKAKWMAEYDMGAEEFEKRYAAVRRPNDPPTFAGYAKASGSRVRETGYADLLARMMDSERIGQHLNNMAWGVFTYNGPMTFMMSDKPVMMTNGLMYPDSHLIVPISPKKLFIAAKEPQMLRRIGDAWRTDPDSAVEGSNDIIVRRALRFVYAVDDRQLRFVENRLRRAITPNATVADSDQTAN